MQVVGGEPGCEQEKPHIPKREVAINPINLIGCAVSWQCSLFVRAKIEHCKLNPRPFRAAFDVLHRVAFFKYFISQIFILTLFEWANKIVII